MIFITHCEGLEMNLGTVQSDNHLDQEVLNLLMMMSHDTRSGLVSMAAILKPLSRCAYGEIADQTIKTVLSDLYSRILNLIGILEDGLGNALIIKGSFHIEQEDLDLEQDIIDPVLDELSTDLRKYNITIASRLKTFSASRIRVCGSAFWLKAIFRNLFRNGIKFGGRGCTIIFGYEKQGSQVEINVYNSGEPIPEENRAKLFTRFARIGDHDRKHTDGVGLGLYLIKQILNEHGGDIRYEAAGTGSNFVFTLLAA